MIEFCSKKRMLLACGLLISISVVVLLIENNWSFSESEIKDHPEGEEKSIEAPCWKEENVEIVKECRPCSDLDIKIHDYCAKTGYKEKVKCLFENGTEKYEYRSCPKLMHIEERGFWSLEAAMVFVGLLSFSVVHMRQTKLNKELMERVHKQIAAGV